MTPSKRLFVLLAVMLIDSVGMMAQTVPDFTKWSPAYCGDYAPFVTNALVYCKMWGLCPNGKEYTVKCSVRANNCSTPVDLEAHSAHYSDEKQIAADAQGFAPYYYPPQEWNCLNWQKCDGSFVNVADPPKPC